MTYAEMDSIEAGQRFKSPSGLIVETTGNTSSIDVHQIYVHEVKIVEGEYAGEVFLLNLDYAEPLS
ncbi:MAG: hypothetical protein ACE5KI_00300 [Dehalococcoidia bacterium]